MVNIISIIWIQVMLNFWADIVDALNSGSFPEDKDLKV